MSTGHLCNQQKLKSNWQLIYFPRYRYSMLWIPSILWHRIIWADICNQALYGQQPHKISRTPASKVKSIDSASKDKYMEWVLSTYVKEDLPNLKLWTIFSSLKEMELIFNLKLKNFIMNLNNQLFLSLKKVDKYLSKFLNNSFPSLPQM